MKTRQTAGEASRAAPRIVQLEPGNMLARFGTFASFRVPAYRIYYGCMLGHWFAWSMQQVVRALLMFRLTGSGTTIGGLALASALPTLSLSLLGGAIGDSVQKKFILVIGRGVLALNALAISFALYSGFLSRSHPDSWWLLIVSAAIEGATNGFVLPTNISIVPELVGEDLIMNGLSLAVLGGNVFQLIGPTVGGFLIDAHGFLPVYFFMSCLFVSDAVMSTLLPRRSPMAPRKTKPLRDAMDGILYLRTNPTILLLVIFAVCHIVSGLPFMQLLPVFTERVLKVTASKLGLLTSAAGVGALIGSLVIASLPRKNRGILVLASGMIMGVPILIFVSSHSWLLCLLLMPFIGLGPAMHASLTSTLVQTYVEPDYRSRMQGLVTMAGGLASFGTLLGGLLTDVIGVRLAVASEALFLTLVAAMLMGWSRLPSLE